MSPEVRMGDDATPASDLFSFSLVMWQFLTRELPFAELGVK
jgi:hypothetical protein